MKMDVKDKLNYIYIATNTNEITVLKILRTSRSADIILRHSHLAYLCLYRTHQPH